MITATIRTMIRITTNPTKIAGTMPPGVAEAITMTRINTTITKITITTIMEANMTTAKSSSTTSKTPRDGTRRSIVHGSRAKSKRTESTRMTSIVMLAEVIAMEIHTGQIEQLKQEGAPATVTKNGGVVLSTVATLVTRILGIKTQVRSSKSSVARSTPVSTKATMIIPSQCPSKQTKGLMADWAQEV